MAGVRVRETRGQGPYTRGQGPYTRGQGPYTRGQGPYTRGQGPYTRGTWRSPAHAAVVRGSAAGTPQLSSYLRLRSLF